MYVWKRNLITLDIFYSKGKIFEKQEEINK